MLSEISITLEKATELCKAHRDKNGVRMSSHCWARIRFCKRASEKMCFCKPPNNDGCKIVNNLSEASNWEDISKYLSPAKSTEELFWDVARDRVFGKKTK